MKTSSEVASLAFTDIFAFFVVIVAINSGWPWRRRRFQNWLGVITVVTVVVAIWFFLLYYQLHFQLLLFKSPSFLSLSLSLHPDWNQERNKWKNKKTLYTAAFRIFFFLGWANEILLYTSRLQGWKFPTRPGPYYRMSKSFTPNKICLGRAVICAVYLKIRNFRYVSLLVFLTFFLISLRVLRIFGILKRKNSRLILHWKMSVS